MRAQLAGVAGRVQSSVALLCVPGPPPGGGDCRHRGACQPLSEAAKFGAVCYKAVMTRERVCSDAPPRVGFWGTPAISCEAHGPTGAWGLPVPPPPARPGPVACQRHTRVTAVSSHNVCRGRKAAGMGSQEGMGEWRRGGQSGPEDAQSFSRTRGSNLGVTRGTYYPHEVMLCEGHSKLTCPGKRTQGPWEGACPQDHGTRLLLSPQPQSHGLCGSEQQTWGARAPRL